MHAVSLLIGHVGYNQRHLKDPLAQHLQISYYPDLFSVVPISLLKRDLIRNVFCMREMNLDKHFSIKVVISSFKNIS